LPGDIAEKQFGSLPEGGALRVLIGEALERP
jgi:hypothetical protein